MSVKYTPIQWNNNKWFYDAVLIVTHHRDIDYGRICEQAQLVIDTRNATRAFRADFGDKIVTL